MMRVRCPPTACPGSRTSAELTQKPFDDSFPAIAAEEEEREEITLAASPSHLEARGRTTGEGENAAAVTNW